MNCRIATGTPANPRYARREAVLLRRSTRAAHQTIADGLEGCCSARPCAPVEASPVLGSVGTRSGPITRHSQRTGQTIDNKESPEGGFRPNSSRKLGQFLPCLTWPPPCPPLGKRPRQSWGGLVARTALRPVIRSGRRPDKGRYRKLHSAAAASGVISIVLQSSIRRHFAAEIWPHVRGSLSNPIPQAGDSFRSVPLCQNST